MRVQHIFLIKHGETEENRLGIHQGQAVGGTLSQRGAHDLRQVGTAFAESRIVADQMLVSPMPRCRASADVLSQTVAPFSTRTDRRLAAKDSGHLGGQPRETAMAEAARVGVPVHQLRTPNGESSEDVQARYVNLWREIASTSAQTTVLVGHGGGIACLLLHLTGHSFDRYLDLVPGSADTTWVEVIDGIPHIRCMNTAPNQLLGQLTDRAAR
ncbi:histidine phosphatase family protein [Streptomyces kanamyceticus]|uniref:Histidine phosphatase family protein n=1 Tax=Streptomyces kanamyceticus TaxID=1967 RepID=A0A5J6GSE1_STRKN|nr:histidine phosphatase family protein [Streptomyces kanamyceticus]QEU95906.1 histidine phosphatase family protein [Streptomyces kanamyceticus]